MESLSGGLVDIEGVEGVNVRVRTLVQSSGGGRGGGGGGVVRVFLFIVPSL